MSLNLMKFRPIFRHDSYFLYKFDSICSERNNFKLNSIWNMFIIRLNTIRFRNNRQNQSNGIQEPKEFPKEKDLTTFGS